MKKVSTSLVLPGDLKLNFKTVNKGIPDLLGLEVTICDGDGEVGYITGYVVNKTEWSQASAGCDLSEGFRAAWAFFIHWEEPLSLLALNLAYPLCKNRLLFLEREFLFPKYRGQQIGAVALRAVIDLCKRYYAIDVAIAHIAPMQHEKGGAPKYEFPRGDYLEDMRHLADYYIKHLGPVAWAGDYMLIPSRGRIPAAMSQWQPTEKPQSPSLPQWFFEREVWLFLSPGRTALVTTPPSNEVQLPPDAKMLHYICGVEESDLNISVPENVALLIEPSDLLRTPPGTLIARKKGEPKGACEIWLQSFPERDLHLPPTLQVVRYKKGARYADPDVFHTLSDAINAMCSKTSCRKSREGKVTRP